MYHILLNQLLWQSRVMRFTPSWYSVTMGTGICNTLLFLLPWQSTHTVFRAIGAAFLILDILIFIVFTAMTVARYSLYPEIFMAMLGHPVHSLFLGTLPMGFVVKFLARIFKCGGIAYITFLLDHRVWNCISRKRVRLKGECRDGSRILVVSFDPVVPNRFHGPARHADETETYFRKPDGCLASADW